MQPVTGARFRVINALPRAIPATMGTRPTAYIPEWVSRPNYAGIQTSNITARSDRAHNSGTVPRDEIPNEFPAGSTLLREFVRVAEAKLGQLHARKEHLCRRLQALRYLASHAGEKHSRGTRSQGSCPIPIRKSANGTVSESTTPPQAFEKKSKLRRACRIALMEDDHFQNSAQVYERIQKRGSMSFAGYDNPLQALAIELQAMVADSEILCSQINGEMRYKGRG